MVQYRGEVDRWRAAEESKQRSGSHAFREAGAPKCSNYALSWIGMANTIFLADLYAECINGRVTAFVYK
jgi:hypothetical protein